MNTKNSYRKEIQAVLQDKITDCDEAIFAKIEGIRKIANLDRFDSKKITELCRQIEIACNESELLKELVKVKKPSKQIENLVSEMSKLASTGSL